MNSDGYKEVYFYQYCATCKHETTDEKDEPCYECLGEFTNAYSHKPVKWVEKDK